MGLVLIRMEQGAGLGLHVLDQPHGVVGVGQGVDHRPADGEVLFLPGALFRYIGYEHVVHAAVGLGLGVMAVIVHPAHRAVPADDAVLHVVHAVLAAIDLIQNGAGDGLVILGTHHALEGVARQLPEFRKVGAAENVKNRLVGVQKGFGFLGAVDKKSTGHMPADLRDHGDGFRAELQLFA